MPPLPPKPKAPLLAEQVLVVAALATSACAARIPPRIGQPPDDYVPVTCPEVQDDGGEGLAGASVALGNGIALTTDAGGVFAPGDYLGPVTIEHPGYGSVTSDLDCSGEPIVLTPTSAEPVPEHPVRIGPPPELEAVAKPPDQQ